MRREFQVVTRSFVCFVATEDGTVVEAAPLLRKFLGQPSLNLHRWLSSKFDRYRVNQFPIPRRKK